MALGGIPVEEGALATDAAQHAQPGHGVRAEPDQLAGLLALAGLALLQGLDDDRQRGEQDRDSEQDEQPELGRGAQQDDGNDDIRDDRAGEPGRDVVEPAEPHRVVGDGRDDLAGRHGARQGGPGVGRLPADELDRTEGGPQPVLDREPVPDRAGPRDDQRQPDDGPAPRPQRPLVAGDEPSSTARLSAAGSSAWATIQITPEDDAAGEGTPLAPADPAHEMEGLQVRGAGIVVWRCHSRSTIGARPERPTPVFRRPGIAWGDVLRTAPDPAGSGRSPGSSPRGVVHVARLLAARRGKSSAREEMVQRAENSPTVPVDTLIAPHGAFPGLDSSRRVSAVGRYDADRQFLVVDRRLMGVAGSWVVTPLVVETTGARLAVLRGFTTANQAPPPSQLGTVTVVGSLAPGSPVGGRRAAGGPDGLIDLSILANRWDGDLYNAFVFAISETPDATGASAAPARSRVPPPSPDPGCRRATRHTRSSGGSSRPSCCGCGGRWWRTSTGGRPASGARAGRCRPFRRRADVGSTPPRCARRWGCTRFWRWWPVSRCSSSSRDGASMGCTRTTSSPRTGAISTASSTWHYAASIANLGSRRSGR